MSRRSYLAKRRSEATGEKHATALNAITALTLQHLMIPEMED